MRRCRWSPLRPRRAPRRARRLQVALHIRVVVATYHEGVRCTGVRPLARVPEGRGEDQQTEGVALAHASLTPQNAGCAVRAVSKVFSLSREIDRDYVVVHEARTQRVSRHQRLPGCPHLPVGGRGPHRCWARTPNDVSAGQCRMASAFFPDSGFIFTVFECMEARSRAEIVVRLVS